MPVMRWAGVCAALAAVVLLWPAGSAAREPGGDVARGEDLYQAHCAMCHGADASGMMGMHPALRGAVDRLTVEGVEVTIRQGRDTRPPMPAFGGRLGDDDVADLVAYLDALPPGPRNFGPQAGQGPMGGGPMGERMRDMMGAGMAVPLPRDNRARGRPGWGHRLPHRPAPLALTRAATLRASGRRRA